MLIYRGERNALTVEFILKLIYIYVVFCLYLINVSVYIFSRFFTLSLVRYNFDIFRTHRKVHTIEMPSNYNKFICMIALNNACHPSYPYPTTPRPSSSSRSSPVIPHPSLVTLFLVPFATHPLPMTQ